MTDELIARLESADGPSRELDWAIAESLGWTRRQVGQVIACYAPSDPHMKAGAPRYTASIDAALTLVPEGWQHGYATIPSGDILRAETHHAQAYVDGSEMQDFTKYFRAEAATPALAIAAAALKARGV